MTKFSEKLTSEEKRDPLTIESKFKEACSETKGKVLMIPVLYFVFPVMSKYEEVTYCPASCITTDENRNTTALMKAVDQYRISLDYG